MKLTPITSTRSTGLPPQGRVSKNGTISFTASAANTYNFPIGERVTIARDDELEDANPGEVLYILFSGRKGADSRKITGKPRRPGIAMAGIFNRLDLDYETKQLIYEITREFTYDGTRTLELKLKEAKKR